VLKKKSETLEEKGVGVVNVVFSRFVNTHRLRLYKSAEDLEDMRQECYIEMLARLPKFKPDRGALSTFLSPRIVGFVKDQLKKDKRLRKKETKYHQTRIRSQFVDILQLDKQGAVVYLSNLNIPDSEIENLIIDIADLDESQNLLDSFCSLSDTRLYIIICYFLLDKRIEEISSALNFAVDSGWVHRIKREGIKILQQELLNKGL